METQKALDRIKQILAPEQLSYVEELVFTYTLSGKRYRDMSVETGYEEGYLKDVGSRLWSLLSECLDCRVTKKNVHLILNHHPAIVDSAMHARSEDAKVISVIREAPSNYRSHPSVPEEANPSEDSFAKDQLPGSPLVFGSPFYIDRPPIEEMAVAALHQPGSVIRIQAPWRMGKTSLINYLIGHARKSGMKPIFVDLRQTDISKLDDLDKLLQWFCWTLSHQLNLPSNFNDCWLEYAGAKVSCTTYMQEHILSQIESPVVVAIDTMHYLLTNPYIAKNFFSMLRFWYEKARVHRQWQKLRLILSYVAELDVPLQPHQSPFNVGLLVELPPLTSPEVHHLAKRYAVGHVDFCDEVALQPLFDLVGGHPYLLQLAFYWLGTGQLSLSQLLQEATTDEGIYREHLNHVWQLLQEDKALLDAFCQVVSVREPVSLERNLAYRLQAMGLAQVHGCQVLPQCELYRSYLSSLLEVRFC